MARSDQERLLAAIRLREDQGDRSQYHENDDNHHIPKPNPMLRYENRVKNILIDLKKLKYENLLDSTEWKWISEGYESEHGESVFENAFANNRGAYASGVD